MESGTRGRNRYCVGLEGVKGICEMACLPKTQEPIFVIKIAANRFLKSYLETVVKVEKLRATFGALPTGQTFRS